MIAYETIHPDVPTPRRAHPTDAGIDLVAWSPDIPHIPIRPGERAVIGTGIKVAIPQGHVGLVVVRSSTGIKYGLTLANSIGVIDTDYRGEIKVCLHNLGDKTQVVTHTERIAQIVIMPISTAEWCESPLDTTDRGAGGIGSTGTH